MNIISSMSLWNKILLVLIAIATLVFFHAAARTLKTQKYWVDLGEEFRKGDKRGHKGIEQYQRENQALLDADEANLLPDKTVGIHCLERQLRETLINRGRVWDKCEPAEKRATNPAQAEVAVNTDKPVPNGITVKMVLYVFEEGDDQNPGNYIGEFKVTQVAENRVSLANTMTLTDRELKRLNASKGPWILYELMPADRHDVFADMTDEKKNAVLPEASRPEYLRDGLAAQAGDPADCKTADGKYQRRLRDYKELYKDYHTHRTLFIDSFEALTRDVQYVDAALKDAKVQEQFAEKEVAGLKVELAWNKKQQEAVAAYMLKLQGRVTSLQQRVKDLIDMNLKKAAQIAEAQRQAAILIDQRARSMAQVGAGSER